MCKLCKCDTVKQSTTTHVVNYKNSIIVIKNVPCEECEPAIVRLLTDASLHQAAAWQSFLPVFAYTA